MKRKYEKPVMTVEIFEADEYIASCVRVTCDVPTGTENGNNQIHNPTDTNNPPNKVMCGEEHTIKNMSTLPIPGSENVVTWNIYNWDGIKDVDSKSTTYAYKWRNLTGTHYTELSSSTWNNVTNAS